MKIHLSVSAYVPKNLYDYQLPDPRLRNSEIFYAQIDYNFEKRFSVNVKAYPFYDDTGFTKKDYQLKFVDYTTPLLKLDIFSRNVESSGKFFIFYCIINKKIV